MTLALSRSYGTQRLVLTVWWGIPCIIIFVVCLLIAVFVSSVFVAHFGVSPAAIRQGWSSITKCCRTCANSMAFRPLKPFVGVHVGVCSMPNEVVWLVSLLAGRERERERERLSAMLLSYFLISSAILGQLADNATAYIFCSQCSPSRRLASTLFIAAVDFLCEPIAFGGGLIFCASRSHSATG